MKNICTINHITEDRRVTIAWDKGDRHLYSVDQDRTEKLDEIADTLDDAYVLAGALWGGGQFPWELRTIEPEDKRYMVDEDRCFMEQGDYVGIGDPHATFYDTIDAAEAEYKRLVTRPMDKRDRPVIVTLSQYVAEFDTWDCIKYEVVI